MSRHPYMMALGGMAACGAVLYIALTGQVFGIFINQFARCTQSPEASFPCYGIYDVGIALVAVLAELLCAGIVLYGFFRHRFYARTSGKLLLLVATLIAIGIAIPKLTVHNEISLTDADRICTDFMFRNMANEHMLDRIALMLGKGQIIAQRGSEEFDGRIYTLFDIPLGWLHGQWGESLSISCDYGAPIVPIPVH